MSAFSNTVLRTVLRRAIGVLARLDPALWFALDLRSGSAMSWIPAVLLLAVFAFGAADSLVAGNVGVPAVLSVLALMLLAVKMRAVAHG
jgi:hypothetical protein